MPEKKKTLYGFEVRVPDRRRTERKAAYDIQQLWQRNHEILGLALLGHDSKDIALLMGVHPVTVSNTINSTLGKEKLSRMRKERDEGIINVSEKVAEMSAKALEVYEEIFNNETVSLSLKKQTADTVLMDLGGHRAPTKIDSRNLNVSATTEELEEFKKLGKIAAKEAGFLIKLDSEGESHECLEKA